MAGLAICQFKMALDLSRSDCSLSSQPTRSPLESVPEGPELARTRSLRCFPSQRQSEGKRIRPNKAEWRRLTQKRVPIEKGR